MVRLAQGIMNRAHRCTETEDQRIQDSHPQPYALLSSFFCEELTSIALSLRGRVSWTQGNAFA